MTNEQLAVQLKQIEGRLSTAYDLLFDTLSKDEKYVEQVKGIMGGFKHVAILKPLADLQSDLDNSIDVLVKDQS